MRLDLSPVGLNDPVPNILTDLIDLILLLVLLLHLLIFKLLPLLSLLPMLLVVTVHRRIPDSLGVVVAARVDSVFVPRWRGVEGSAVAGLFLEIGIGGSPHALRTTSTFLIEGAGAIIS